MLSLKSKQYFDVHREAPLNLESADNILFSHEFKRKFEKGIILRIPWICIKNQCFYYNTTFSIANYLRYNSILINFKSRIGYLYFIVKSILLFRLKIISKPAVCFTDSWSHGYFHWMYDSLPRLILSLENSNNFIILPNEFQNIDYVKSSLELLNFNNIKYTKPNSIFLFKRLIFPTHSAPTGNFDPLVIHKLRDKLLSNIETSLKIYDRIYISREKSMRRKVINEEALSSVLKRNGFHVLCMEDYSWKEQMYIFMTCNVLIGIHGAGLSNMIFMKEHSKVIEIRKKGDIINNCYFSLASALKHDYLYLQAQIIGSNEYIQENNFIVDLNELNSILSNYV